MTTCAECLSEFEGHIYGLDNKWEFCSEPCLDRFCKIRGWNKQVNEDRARGDSTAMAFSLSRMRTLQKERTRCRQAVRSATVSES